MESTTNKEKVKFKDTKFIRFIVKHKKLCITIGVITALAVAIIIPVALSNRAYIGDFTYAYNAYKGETQPSKVESAKATFDSTVITEEIDGVEAVISSKDVATGYDFVIPENGKYSLFVNNHPLENGFKDTEFSIDIDGTNVLDRGKIRAYLKNESEEFKVDSYGNEICPTQETLRVWNYQGIYDYQYMLPLPYSFNLSAGSHHINLYQLAGEMVALGEISVRKQETIDSYSHYSSLHADAPYGERIEEIQGEHFAYKNDTSPIPSNSADINVYPYRTMEAMLNTLGNFSLSNQIISYEFTVPTTGNYWINLNQYVNNSNHVTYATIFLDGEIPFGELLHYPFIPTKGYQESILKDLDGTPFNFYLQAGSHVISFKIDTSLYEEAIEILNDSIERFNKIYLSLKRIAGTSSGNKEWDPDTDFPGITEQIKDVYDSLSTINPIIYKVNGSTTNFQALIYLKSALTSVASILKSPRLIPNQYAKFSEGSGSIIENLANAASDLATTPLEIDRIVIGTRASIGITGKKNGWDSFIESIKKFFISFTYDYSGKSKDGKTLEIWVARSRQYVDLMQELIDSSDFEDQTGYKVKFVILSDESKLILSNAAKISPDGVMGISNWLPYEMGIRDLTVDLTQFPDYGETIQRFSTGAMISLIADKKGLALPETQDFYVMYYRKDICSEYGFSLPDTWDDLIGLLPRMQRNGFNFYIPLSTSTSSKSIMTTAPFIYQYGGNLFSDDGLKTTIDEESSLNGIKMMTELFTLYGLESQVANFFNSFRNGSLPIGVSTFDAYVKLTLSAPELAGKWDIEVSPGVDDGESVKR